MSSSYTPAINEVKRAINIHTLLKCTECEKEVERPFKQGDYIGKLSSKDKCPKCGSKMYVHLIYSAVPKKPKRSLF